MKFVRNISEILQNFVLLNCITYEITFNYLDKKDYLDKTRIKE